MLTVKEILSYLADEEQVVSYVGDLSLLIESFCSLNQIKNKISYVKNKDSLTNIPCKYYKIF